MFADMERFQIAFTCGSKSWWWSGNHKYACQLAGLYHPNKLNTKCWNHILYIFRRAIKTMGKGTMIYLYMRRHISRRAMLFYTGFISIPLLFAFQMLRTCASSDWYIHIESFLWSHDISVIVERKATPTEATTWKTLFCNVQSSVRRFILCWR